MPLVLIFVFAGFSCGRARLILAEFGPVPNAPSDVVFVSASNRIPADPQARPDAAAAGPVPTDPPADSFNDRPVETGGPPGPEPTRYGDWEKNGRCIDF
jgi:hypothetical protein